MSFSYKKVNMKGKLKRENLLEKHLWCCPPEVWCSLWKKTLIFLQILRIFPVGAKNRFSKIMEVEVLKDKITESAVFTLVK